MAKKGTLEIKILGDEKPLAKSMDKASGILKGFSAGAVGIFAGLGIAGAVALADGFGKAMEQEKLNDVLAAQLGATPRQAERFGRIAGELYASAYGDSLGHVNQAIDSVVSTLGDLGDERVTDLTAKALDLSAAFGVDVIESVAAAGVALDTGLAESAEQAFDLIVASMQSVPTAMRGELIPIVEEYAQNFSALGITGEEAFGLMVGAAGLGRIELDKTGDALKELTIRATDMSTASSEAFDALGLDAQDMAERFLEGGDTARGALDELVAGLLAVEDPVERANLAIALMGTPLEDLGTNEIPAFLQNLRDMGGGMGDVEDAAVRMGDTLNDNVATKFEEMKRRTGRILSNWIEENILPSVSIVLDAFDEEGLGGAIDKAIELWEEAQPRIEEWWANTFIPWWTDEAVPIMVEVGRELGGAILEGMGEVLEEPFVEFDLGGFLGDQVQNFRNLVGVNTATTSRPKDAPLSQFTAKFHEGGRARVGGLAELAEKERVLSPRQTEAFERLVAQLTSGGGGGTTEINVHMPPGSDGDDVVRALKRWTSRNGPAPFPTAS